MEMKIEYVKINELQPYGNNARDHQRKSIESIKASIREFGFNDPIGVWKGTIVEGHGRWQAATELGYEEVPIIRLDHLTDEQRRAYALAHNKTAEMSDWLDDILSEELQNIGKIDMEQFGFDLENDIIHEEPAPYEDDFDPDRPVEERVHLGDMWKLGDHILICGDSTDQATLDKLMGDDKADLMFTDPPYNVNVENSDGMQILNDNMTESDFQKFITAAMKAAASQLKAGGAFYIWYADSEAISFRQALKESNLSFKQCLIWVKNSFNFGRQDYKWQHEPCLYGWKEGEAHYFVEEFNHPTVMDDQKDIDKMTKQELADILKAIRLATPTTVIREDKPTKNDLHPTMKPVLMCAELIRKSSRQGELVLDPFGGSGSTLIACEEMGRRCRTCELDEHYASVIVKRWEDLTSQKAEKIN